MKRIFPMAVAILCIAVFCLASGACGKNSKASSSPKQEEEQESLSGKYALVTADGDNSYYALVAEGFEKVMQSEKCDYEVYDPIHPTTEDQASIIKQLIKERVSCIAVAPIDSDALSVQMKEARDMGIKMLTYDTISDPEARNLFINTNDVDQSAVTMMDAVLDISGGHGEWAILTTTSNSQTQTQLIETMHKYIEEETYSNIELVEIAYGDAKYRKSYDQTKSLLQNYPDLKVICATSTAAIHAAADAIADSGSKVKLTGFGLPSEIAEYIGDNDICPYMYLWNPIDLGKLTAYAGINLTKDEISGEANEKFKAGNMWLFTVTEASDGGTEVILGSPYLFNSDNIDNWKDIF